MRLVTIRYRMTSTYTKDVDLDSFPSGSPVPTDDLRDFADWLENHPDGTFQADLTEVDNWVDSDPGSVVVDEVEWADA